MGEIWILFVAPAIVAFVAIYLGIHLLKKSSRPYASTKFRRALGILCLLVALGIGACYGFVFFGKY
jgi:hypothetical protein